MNESVETYWLALLPSLGCASCCQKSNQTGKLNQIRCKIKKERQKRGLGGGEGATMCHNIFPNTRSIRITDLSFGPLSDLIHDKTEKGLRHASGPVHAKHTIRYICCGPTKSPRSGITFHCNPQKLTIHFQNVFVFRSKPKVYSLSLSLSLSKIQEGNICTLKKT